MCAMVHRALLAARSPPRLRRCLLVLPEDASMGLAPRRAARAAQPAGVGVRGDQELGCADGADAVTVEQGGCLRGDQGGDLLFQLACFLVQGQPAAPEADQGTVQAIAGIKGCAGPHEACLAQRRKPAAQLVAGVQQEGLDLVRGLGAGLHGAAPGDHEDSQLAYGPAAVLGHGRGLAGQDGPGRRSRHRRGRSCRDGGAGTGPGS